MSRIGKLPVLIPENVSVSLDGQNLTIKGPFGELVRKINDEINVSILENKINITKNVESRIARQKYGLIRSLINNMVIGVSQKFERKLQMVGVGYRSQIDGNTLKMNVGFSHPVLFSIPEGLEVIVESNTTIIVRGADKEKVGLFSSQIHAIRPPEPYKGKGILYFDEVILRKAGKSGK